MKPFKSLISLKLYSGVCERCGGAAARMVEISWVDGTRDLHRFCERDAHEFMSAPTPKNEDDALSA